MELGMNRRAVLRTAATLGLTAGLGGCVTSGGGGATPFTKGPVSAENPLGVPAEAPLEVVIFKGGFSDDYARHAEDLYTQRYSKAKINHQGIQKVGPALQPRFVGDNPPDVVNNDGADNLDIAALIAANKIKNLGELLDAPSLDNPNVKVRDILLPGVVDDGSFDGTCRAVNYVYTVFGIWYSKSLFARHGWTYPTTWEGMLALCEEIKKAGIAAWTWQGKYPEYFLDPLLTLATKAAGPELVKSIDNLEPNAWKHEAVRSAAEAVYELAGRGYIMAGSEALSHIEAQNAWSQGKAAFIPCGSWLESEQKSVMPTGFDMVVAPLPALTNSDKLPIAAMHAASTGPFLVPTKARNPQGGLEFLRVLLSKPAARKFTELTGSLPSVAGAADGVTVSSGFDSVREAIKAAGSNVFSYRYHNTWYKPLGKAADDNTGELITRRITPTEWVNRMQHAADAVARDSSIKKYRR